LTGDESRRIVLAGREWNSHRIEPEHKEALVSVVAEFQYDITAVQGPATQMIHWDVPRTITVHCAISAVGAGEGPYVEVGLSGFAENFGPMQPLGSSDVIGTTLPKVWSGTQVTDLWLTARSFESWVQGSARVLEWG
jgi:hypothetical protein